MTYLEHLVTAMIAGAILAVGWILRTLGDRHLKSIDELTKEVKELRKEVASLGVRLIHVEDVQHDLQNQFDRTLGTTTKLVDIAHDANERAAD